MKGVIKIDMQFDEYITRKTINKQGIAKYSDRSNVRLTYEDEGHEQETIEMSRTVYDKMIEAIPEHYDILAWILENMFDCNMVQGE
jgi:hypothetical protein